MRENFSWLVGWLFGWLVGWLVGSWPSIVLIFVDFREENQITRRKPLEALERSTAETLSHEMSHPYLGFSGERHNACFPNDD